MDQEKKRSARLYEEAERRFQDTVRQSLMTESYNACVSVAEIVSNGFYIE